MNLYHPSNRFEVYKKTYDSDLTDKQWKILAPLIPPAKPGGRPRTVDMREVLNAIFYILCVGCARTWRKNGVWEQMNQALREKVRLQA